jgi:hypothetical protein
VKQPEPETRGGEEPGSWGVDGTVIAKAAAIRSQLIMTTQTMNLGDSGSNSDTE